MYTVSSLGTTYLMPFSIFSCRIVVCDICLIVLKLHPSVSAFSMACANCISFSFILSCLVDRPQDSIITAFCGIGSFTWNYMAASRGMQQWNYHDTPNATESRRGKVEYLHEISRCPTTISYTRPHKSRRGFRSRFGFTKQHQHCRINNWRRHHALTDLDLSWYGRRAVRNPARRR